MRCFYHSSFVPCTGEPTMHLRRVLATVPHPDSTPEVPVLIVTRSEYVGAMCRKHAQQMMDACGDVVAGDDNTDVGRDGLPIWRGL